MSERNEIAAENEYQNLVLLRGRVSKSPVSRILPSGDEVVEFRLIVDRTPAKSKANSRTDFDLIDLVIWQKRLQKRALKFAGGEFLSVEGAVRRRFWQSTSGLASRWQVEVMDLALISAKV